MINILFIGGAGFIGSNVVRCFINDKKYRIFVYEPSLANISKLSDYEDEIILFRGYLSDFELLSNIVLENKIDKIVHLVSTLIPGSSYEDYKKEYEDVIFPTVQLMGLCAKLKIEFIYFSSGGTVYGNDAMDKLKETDELSPISYYGLSKQIIENSILFENRIKDLPFLIIRPSNPFGPGQALNGAQGLIAVAFGKLLSNKPLEIWGDGNSIRDYIYIDDLCNSFFQLVDKNITNTVINIGSGYGYTINEIIEKLNNIINEEVKVRYEKSRLVDVSRMVLDISKLRSIINVKHTPLEIGMKKFYENINSVIVYNE